MKSKTRKLIWSAPLVAVLAVAATLAIFAAQPPGVALAHDPPGVVGNLMGEADGTNAIDLRWDAPAMGGTPTSYRIDRSMNGNTWMTHVTGHTMRTYSDMKLKPGTSYYYRVFAVNAAGTGPVSQDYQVQTDVGTPTSAVISLRAMAMGQNQVNLMWTAPAKLGGSPITKYSIHFAMGTGTIPVQSVMATDLGVMDVDADDGTSYEHKMLDANTRYKYVVYAHNATGKSMMPSDTTAAMTAPLVKPGAPTGVTAVQTGDRMFTLYWYAPTEIGGTAVIDYEVHASYNGGSFNEVDTITWTGIGATFSADSSVDTVNADDGGTPPVPYTTVGYRVYAITRNADDGPPPITELKSTRYGQSDRMTIVADADLPKTIPVAPAFATGEQAIRDPKGSVNLKWTAPAIDEDDNTDDNAPPSIGGYRIDVSDDGMSWRSLIDHTRKTATEYQYVDEERKDRHYRIFAWHSQHLGPAQEPVTLSALDTGEPVAPGHVTSFTATAVEPTQIDLAWTAPENDGGAPIVRYQIAGVRQADGTFAAFPTAEITTDGMLFATSKTTGYMHKDLNAGETWRYQVLTVTDDSSDSGNIRMSAGDSAETRTATTHQSDLPDAPEGLTAEDAKDSSNTGTVDRGVLLLWNAPNAPDGAMIDGYRIQRKKGDAAWETLVMDTNNVFTDYTDTLEPEAGEMRMYQVAALNGSTMGAWSNTAYYPLMDHMHTPNMPMSVMAAASSDTEIKVTWESPTSDGGSAITGYMVQSRYMMADDMMSEWMNVDPAHTGMKRMYMDMDLMSETTYYYRVAAKNVDGTGAYSDGEATEMTPAPTMELGKVTGVSADGFNAGGSMQVSWMPAANAQSYIIIAVNIADTSDTQTAVVDGGMRTTGAVSRLTSGQTYNIFVAALGSMDVNTLSEHIQVVAN